MDPHLGTESRSSQDQKIAPGRRNRDSLAKGQERKSWWLVNHPPDYPQTEFRDKDLESTKLREQPRTMHDKAGCGFLF